MRGEQRREIVGAIKRRGKGRAGRVMGKGVGQEEAPRMGRERFGEGKVGEERVGVSKRTSEE